LALKIGFVTFNRAWLLAQGTASGEHLSRVLVLEAEHKVGMARIPVI
jgi:hypothetical protein